MDAENKVKEPTTAALEAKVSELEIRLTVCETNLGAPAPALPAACGVDESVQIDPRISSEMPASTPSAPSAPTPAPSEQSAVAKLTGSNTDFSFHNTYAAGTSASINHRWPKSRINQMYNMAYFGGGAISLYGLSETMGGQFASLGLALCLAFVFVSAFYLVAYRTHVTPEEELPVWARRALRSLAFLLPAAFIGFSVFTPNTATSSISVTPPVPAAPLVSVAEELAIADRLYGEDEFEKAVPHYEKVVALDPLNEHSFDRLADSSLRLDVTRDAEAIAYADKALALNPHNSSALSSKSWALNNMDKFADALTVAKLAAKEDPSNGEAYASMAIAQRGLHDFAGALANDNKHVRIHNDEPAAYRFRAESLTSLGRKNEAKADEAYAKKLEKADSE